MGTLTPLRFGPRRVDYRLLVLFRTDPANLARHLPPRSVPRLQGGQAILGVSYVRLGPPPKARWLPVALGAPHDHLVYSAAARIEEESVTCVLHRSASPTKKADARDGGRYHFELQADEVELELSVQSAAQEEFYLRAELAPHARGTGVFPTQEAAREFLIGTTGPRPPDPSAPEVDDLGLDHRQSVLAPLHVFEWRSPRLESELFDPGSLQLDCAFRLVHRRMEPVPRRSAARLRDLLEQGETAPAAPGF